MAQALVHRVLADDSITPAGVSDLLSLVLDSDRDTIIRQGVDTAVTLAQRYRDGPQLRERAIASAVEVLDKRPAEACPHLWPLLTGDRDFGRAVALRLAQHHRQSHVATIGSLLPEAAVGELYVWLRREFPPKEDPDRGSDEAYSPSEREQVAEFRDALLSRLRERGTREAVAAIQKAGNAVEDGRGLSYVALLADRSRLRMEWHGTPPKTIFEMAANRQVRPIESPAQLMRVIIDSLRRLEQKLHGVTPAVVDLWKNDEPIDEKALSDYIDRHLNSDLIPLGVLASREAEVRRGQETDIYVDAIVRGPLGGRLERVSVVVEVKGCWNGDLKNAMEDQLKGRYLRDHPTGCGIYLVGWFASPKWRGDDWRKGSTPKWTLEHAREFFTQLAAKLSDAKVTLEAFVLDGAPR